MTMDAGAVLFLWLLVAVGCGTIGSMIGEKRGRGAAGFWLGFVLGPLGCLAALFLPKE